MPNLLSTYRQAYNVQRNQAKARSIEWEFTFETWLEWWMTDDRISRRGRNPDDLVMCRIGDVGPYSPVNCYADTARNNSILAGFARRPLSKPHWRTQPAGRAHDSRPRSVITPEGEFPSIASAARHHGFSAPRTHKLVNSKNPFWRYA